MRATGRSAILAAASLLGAIPAGVRAQPLPAPPYQSADQAAYPQQGPQSLDRYGGGYSRPHFAVRAAGAQGVAQQPSGPYLAWAGKTEMQVASAPAAAETGGWSNMAGRWDAQPQRSAPQLQRQAQVQTEAQSQPEMRAAELGPPVNPWRPYRPQNTAPPPAPTSIYDTSGQAQAATPQPYRQAQAAPSRTAATNDQNGPRFYSLHREYGIQPDPIPLPPQFFGPTADLSSSVADPLAKRTTVVNGQTKTVNVPDDQGAQ